MKLTTKIVGWVWLITSIVCAVVALVGRDLPSFWMPILLAASAVALLRGSQIGWWILVGVSAVMVVLILVDLPTRLLGMDANIMEYSITWRGNATGWYIGAAIGLVYYGLALLVLLRDRPFCWQR